MAIAPLPESKQLELQLLDLPWPRPQLRLVQDTALAAGTGDSDDLVPWLAPLAGYSHRDEAPTPVELVALPVTEDRAAPTAARRPASARVRRRRQQVAVAAAAVATLAILFAGPLGGSGRTPGPAQLSGTLPVQTVAGEGTFVSAPPGATLASIARQLDPSNPSAEAAHLAGLLGSNVVVAGEHIPVPSS